MSILLDAAYLAGLALGSPYLAYKAATSEKYRTGLGERLGRVAAREGDAPCLWLHTVSVGEANLAKPLVAGLAERRPEWEVVLSTATNTGQATARELYPGRRVIYYPLDFSWAVARAMGAVRPDLVLLVELEVWPNFLAAAARRGVPVAVVNGRMSEGSFRRYRLIKPLVARWLGRVALFCVQNETYAARLAALGAPEERLVVTGNLKFDACPAAPPAGRDEALAASFGLRPGEELLVAGCTWPGEDEAIVPIYQRLKADFPRLRLLLAPRQADRFGAVERLVREAGLPCVRRTALREGAEPPADAVLLLDTMGELARVYGLGTVVFVGGSLTRHGGQNMIEAASLARPVLFGRHTENFRDITEELLAHGAARRVADGAALEAGLRELLGDPAAAADLGARARQVVDRNRGATARTLAALEPLFHRAHQEGSHRA